MPEQTFGIRLAMVRRHLGWNIKKASEETGIDDGSWSAWERGALPRDLGAIVRKINAATGVDMGWLVFGIAPSDGSRAGVTQLPMQQPPVPTRLFRVAS